MCLVKSQTISKYYVSTCIGTYSGKEECIHHSVYLKSSIRTSWTVRIWKRKQEFVNIAIRKYFPLKLIPQCFLCNKSLGHPLNIKQETDIIISFADTLALICFITLLWSKNHRNLVLLLKKELKGHLGQDHLGNTMYHSF